MKTTRAFASLAVVSALSVSLLVAPSALAHGGFPRAFEILVEPGNPNDVVLRSDLWGFFRTRDGGQSWQWTCAEVYGADSYAVNHQEVALAAGGRLFVANSFKGLFYTDDGCSWTTVPELSDGKLVIDVQALPDAVDVITSTNTGTDAGISGLFFQSKDNGAHFSTVGTPLPSDFAASALGVATADEKRVYVIGRFLEATPGTVMSSADGGTTWKPSEIPVTDAFMTLRMAGIHPTRPDVVFVWGDLKEALGQDAPDEIWGSSDAGATWKKLYTGAGDLPGFALSPDGTEILVGGPKDGMQIAKLDDALVNGQSAFSEYFTSPDRPEPNDKKVWGLLWNDAGLSGGLDNFARAGIPAFTYGLFSDADKDFSELMSVCDAQWGTCGSTSSVTAACSRIFTEQGGFETDYLKSSRCVGTADGGAHGSGGASGKDDAPASKDSGGCSYAHGSASSTSYGAWLVSIFVVALGLRVTRRRQDVA